MPARLAIHVCRAVDIIPRACVCVCASSSFKFTSVFIGRPFYHQSSENDVDRIHGRVLAPTANLRARRFHSAFWPPFTLTDVTSIAHMALPFSHFFFIAVARALPSLQRPTITSVKIFLSNGKVHLTVFV